MAKAATRTGTSAVGPVDASKLRYAVVDYNPRALPNIPTVTAEDQKKVNVKRTPSESRIETDFEVGTAVADENGKRWIERNKKEGKKRYECPVCGFKHDLRKNVAAHIKQEHPTQVEAMKLQKMPPANYTPRQIIESPKRTYADFMSPAMAERMSAISKTREAAQKLEQDGARHANRRITATSLMAMPEGLALQKLFDLPPDELAKAARMAHFRGRRLLIRELRKLCKTNGIRLDF
jgi:predicted RNA-binding Zn-ribbon protein involved in translation (DUF1610 family)